MIVTSHSDALVVNAQFDFSIIAANYVYHDGGQLMTKTVGSDVLGYSWTNDRKINMFHNIDAGNIYSTRFIYDAGGNRVSKITNYFTPNEKKRILE